MVRRLPRCRRRILVLADGNVVQTSPSQIIRDPTNATVARYRALRARRKAWQRIHATCGETTPSVVGRDRIPLGMSAVVSASPGIARQVMVTTGNARVHIFDGAAHGVTRRCVLFGIDDDSIRILPSASRYVHKRRNRS